MIKLIIKGIPQPKQSVRFRSFRMGDKNIVQSYQKKEVIDNERNIKYDVKSQLPLDFVPFDKAIGVRGLFVFPPLSSWSKKKKQQLTDGEVIYKDTKPDLTDNLMKGTMDALNGLVFTDDSRICAVETKKIFGFVPRIELEFYLLES